MPMPDALRRHLTELRQQKRGTLLKDVPADWLLIACDHAEEGGVLQAPVVTDPLECAYLRWASQEQVQALAKRMLAVTVAVRAPGEPGGLRRVPVFDRAAVVHVLRFVGVSKPDRYLRRLDTINHWIDLPEGLTMPIYTSNFARARLLPPDLRAVSIARWPPRWWGKRERYPLLAPPADLLKRFRAGILAWCSYEAEYIRQLAALDALHVAEKLQGAVLLCHCAQGEALCHRRLAADWLAQATGQAVQEWEAPPVAPEMQTIRALTVRQPWAAEIMTGRKAIEYRTWRTEYRGPLVLHAAARKAPPDMPCPVPMVYGAVLGTVDVMDCVLVDGLWEWRLSNPRPLAAPVPCPGFLGLWTPPPDILAML